MLKRIGIAALLGSALLAGHAQAADMATKYAPPPPPAPPPYSWTGFYLGINGGAGWGTTTSSVDVGKTICINTGFCGLNLTVPLAQTELNGYLFGGQAGYNYQFGKYVIGIEGDADWSNLDGTSPCVLIFYCESKVKWTADIAGRLGFLPLNNLLVYVKGGVSWARIDDSFNNSATLTFGSAPGPTATFAGQVSSDLSQTRVGGLLGIGTEYAFDPHWRVKIEYDYADYGKHNDTPSVNASGSATFCPPVGVGPGCFGPSGAITFPVAVQTQTQIHTVRAGVNYNF